MIGIFAMSVAVVGYFGRKLSVFARMGLAALGAATLPLALAKADWGTVNLVCAVLVLVALGYRLFATRRSVPA
jgi:TRAP-type uncharacterized transport system fused permease subunit